jgi:hypothetical protein
VPNHKQLSFPLAHAPAVVDGLLARALAHYAAVYPVVVQQYRWGQLATEPKLTIWGKVGDEPLTVSINYRYSTVPPVLLAEFWFPDSVGAVMVRVAEAYIRAQVQAWMTRPPDGRSVQ